VNINVKRKRGKKAKHPPINERKKQKYLVYPEEEKRKSSSRSQLRNSGRHSNAEKAA